jgi:hypothetical protein
LQWQLANAVHPLHDEPEFDGHELRHATVKPVAAEYFPAAQSVHATEPVVALYFPVAQAKHGPPLIPVYPKLQMHSKDVIHTLHVAPEFVGQDVHAAVPLVDLYFPAPQAVHAVPLGHTVFVRSTLCCIAFEISTAAARVSSSSTMKRPAISPFQYVRAAGVLDT